MVSEKCIIYLELKIKYLISTAKSIGLKLSKSYLYLLQEGLNLSY
jgi:hypothetical protein